MKIEQYNLLDGKELIRALEVEMKTKINKIKKNIPK